MISSIFPDARTITDLSFTHPLIRMSTLGEVETALQEHIRSKECDLDRHFIKFMNGDDEMNLSFRPKAIESETWMPIARHRYNRVLYASFIAIGTWIAATDVDLFVAKISHEANGVRAHYLQSLITKKPIWAIGGLFRDLRIIPSWRELKSHNSVIGIQMVDTLQRQEHVPAPEEIAGLWQKIQAFIPLDQIP